jgi:hypothetical protein
MGHPRPVRLHAQEERLLPQHDEQRPSGSQSRENGIVAGNVGDNLARSLEVGPEGWVPQLANHRRSWCQRRDCPNARPLSRIRGSGMEFSSLPGAREGFSCELTR